jgi:oligopeptide/dipeptide ABC transporter ATP-binding protein
MYAGRLVELGGVERVLESPSHPYSAALLASIPQIGAKRARLKAIAGLPPDLSEPIRGCAFAPRCGLRVDACAEWGSRLEIHAPGQLSACLRHGELAPTRPEAC